LTQSDGGDALCGKMRHLAAGGDLSCCLFRHAFARLRLTRSGEAI
jgi:hypothetical protein